MGTALAIDKSSGDAFAAGFLSVDGDDTVIVHMVSNNKTKGEQTKEAANCPPKSTEGTMSTRADGMPRLGGDPRNTYYQSQNKTAISNFVLPSFLLDAHTFVIAHIINSIQTLAVFILPLPCFVVQSLTGKPGMYGGTTQRLPWGFPKEDR